MLDLDVFDIIDNIALKHKLPGSSMPVYYFILKQILLNENDKLKLHAIIKKNTGNSANGNNIKELRNLSKVLNALNEFEPKTFKKMFSNFFRCFSSNSLESYESKLILNNSFAETIMAVHNSNLASGMIVESYEPFFIEYSAKSLSIDNGIFQKIYKKYLLAKQFEISERIENGCPNSISIFTGLTENERVFCLANSDIFFQCMKDLSLNVYEITRYIILTKFYKKNDKLFYHNLNDLIIEPLLGMFNCKNFENEYMNMLDFIYRYIENDCLLGIIIIDGLTPQFNTLCFRLSFSLKSISSLEKKLDYLGKLSILMSTPIPEKSDLEALCSIVLNSFRNDFLKCEKYLLHLFDIIVIFYKEISNEGILQLLNPNFSEGSNTLESAFHHSLFEKLLKSNSGIRNDKTFIDDIFECFLSLNANYSLDSAVLLIDILEILTRHLNTFNSIQIEKMLNKILSNLPEDFRKIKFYLAGKIIKIVSNQKNENSLINKISSLLSPKAKNVNSSESSSQFEEINILFQKNYESELEYGNLLKMSQNYYLNKITTNLNQISLKAGESNEDTRTRLPVPLPRTKFFPKSNLESDEENLPSSSSAC